MSSKTIIDKQLQDVQRAHEICYSIAIQCSEIIRILKEKKPSDRSENAHRILEMLDGLELSITEAEDPLRDTKPIFRAAFDPPCTINGSSYTSYHEGVLKIAWIDILLGITEVLFGRPVWETILRDGLDNYQLTYQSQWKPPGTEETCEKDTGSIPYAEMHEKMRVKMMIVQRRLKDMNIDVSALMAALEKEVAKVTFLLSASKGQVHDIVPWSKSKKLSDWTKVWGESKNTVISRLRKMEKRGEARKEGKFWQVDQRQLPVPDDWDAWGK